MISIFTPFHIRDTAFLEQAYYSIKNQTFTDWQWVILLNGEANSMSLTNSDFKLAISTNPKIKIVNAPVSPNGKNIGFLKNYACGLCDGKILLELDFDDILTPDCLQEVDDDFTDESVQMVYSNSCGFESESWKPAEVYSEDYGWRSRPFTYEGHDLIEMIAWKASAQSIRRVEWSPNHVRAWRKSSYDEMLGHDETLSTGDDHDLCCRYYIRYGEKGFHHIDKCLYLYRVHPKNTVKLKNAEIQHQTDQNYLKYRASMASRWAKDNNLRKIDLSGDASGGFELIQDLNGKWNFDDSSVGVIRASHVLGGINNFVDFMNECYRVLAGGGWLFLDAPSTDGRGAFQDPRSKIFINENSLFYYTRRNYANFIPEYKGKFQLSRKCTWYPSDYEKMNDIKMLQADLICLKPPYSDRPVGEVLI